MLSVTLVIGVVVSLLLTELTGLTAGGIIVPGYVALVLDRPAALLGFVAIALASYGVIQLLRRRLLLFGSRRFAVAVLTGLGFTLLAQHLSDAMLVGTVEWAGIGLVVPGLLAHQFDRQGILKTLAALAIAAPLTRLLSVLAVRL
ncbi:MAG: poly-gamma-glutamate biosynthesis protein PgsC [Microvirga sp.]